ncbi:MAG: hypothetical protein U0R24_06915 [Solirubrobacterales bacterium]
MAALAILPASAQAGSGGMGPGSTDPAPTVPGGKAKLVSGIAYAPASAPQAVKDIIAAANKIRNKPYIYGGGHGSFKDKGYDCSGSVSYALHGADLLDTPLDSSSLAKWGEPGAGQWVSVYGAPSHAYMVVAGLRFDTSMTPGNGPGWSRVMRSTPENYKVRHPEGL